MANFFYVKNGGTATGNAGRVATTKSTGSFASKGVGAYYDSIKDVNSVPSTLPAPGDFVMVSNLHNKNHGGTIDLNLLDGVTYISVDDTALDSYLAGAVEGTGSSGVLQMCSGTVSSIEVFSYGIGYNAGSELRILRALDQKFIMEDGYLEILGTNSLYVILISYNSYAGFVSIKNSSFKYANAGQQIDLRDGVTLICENVSTVGFPTNFAKTTGNGVSRLTILNSDLSTMGSGANLISAQVGVDLKVQRCLFPLGTTWVSGSTAVRRVSNVSIRSVGQGSFKDTYNYYYESPVYLGSAEESTVIYRTLGAKYDATNGFSTKIITESTTSQVDPHRLLLRQAPLLITDYTSTVTFKVHFAFDGSEPIINSSQIWIEVVHVDGLDNAKGVRKSTSTPIFGTSNAIDTESGLWTGLGGTNKQMSISLDPVAIGTSAGEITSGVVEVYICCAIASATFYVCPNVVIT